jgi:hypothetical protein
VAPGPEGRQILAQRVSAGFRPHMKTQPRRGDRSPSHTSTTIRSCLQSPEMPRNAKRTSRKASKPPRHPSSPIRKSPDSTGSKSTRSHFTTDVFAERQTHRPGLLRVFASSREPSLLWNENPRKAAMSAKSEEEASPDVFACPPFQPEIHFHAETPSPPRLE